MRQCSKSKLERVRYALDEGHPGEGEPVGASGRAGLASFVEFIARLEVPRVLSERVRLPVQARKNGFTATQKSLALLTALAAGSRSARDSDFTVGPDPVVPAALGLPRWPHSSQLTRHLRAFRPQQVRALRLAGEDLLGAHSAARRRRRRGQRVVIDIDQTPLSANGRTYQRTARGHLKKRGDRGYQATAGFAGDPSGGEDEVLAIFLDPGNAHATWRFADALAALERVLGPLERLPGLIWRFDAQDATADDLALLLRRRIGFIGRRYADRTAATWAREHAAALDWHELSPIKWVADLGTGPVSPGRPDVCCRRVLVRSTGARHRAGYTAIVTNVSAAEIALPEAEPFYEARQTIEGWLSEATAALQLKGLWSRSFDGLEAFLLLAALASNLLTWWARRVVWAGCARPPLGLRQLIARVITVPARVLQTWHGQFLFLLPPAHPYAHRLLPPNPGRQLPLPWVT